MMTITVTGRRVDVPARVRGQIDRQLARLGRLLHDSVVSAQCVLWQEREALVCELTVHARGDHLLVGLGRHARISMAVSLAADKVAEQARRVVDRWKTRRRAAVPAVPRAGRRPT